MKDCLFVFNVLDPLGLIDRVFGDGLECVELVFVDDKVDWAKFAIADLHTWVAVEKLFRSCSLWLRFLVFNLFVLYWL